MVLCWGSELFSGLRSVTRVYFCMCFHHTNFVCGSAIQVGIAIAVHCIYGIQYQYPSLICAPFRRFVAVQTQRSGVLRAAHASCSVQYGILTGLKSVTA